MLTVLLFPLLLGVEAINNCGTWASSDGLDSCYKTFSGSLLTHSEAERECVKLGGHLVSINSAAESQLVLEISRIGHSHVYKTQPWIGLFKQYGTWKWTDGSTKHGHTWAPGQPDNWGGHEDCGMLITDMSPSSFGGQRGVVNDDACGKKHTRFICERKPGIKIGEPEIAEIDCGSWSGMEKLDSCYKVFAGTLVTQQEAEDNCLKLGGHLASINTPDENTFIHAITKLAANRPIEDQPWIGLFKQGSTWRWTDGSTGNGYTWAPRNPDNTNGNEYCGMFVSGFSLNWFSWKTGVINDYGCHRKLNRYVCERKPEVKIGEPKTDENNCGTWSGMGMLDSCYKHFICPPMVQSEAEAECVKLGGHLVSFNKPLELDFVNAISKLGGKYPYNEMPWIGLIKQGGWKWTDGSTGFKFNWAPGQPDNLEGIESCALLIADHDLSFDGYSYHGRTNIVNDIACQYTKTRFICERRPGVKLGKHESRPQCQVDLFEPCPAGTIDTKNGCEDAPEVFEAPHTCSVFQKQGRADATGERKKCESAPYLSYFHEKTQTCYIRSHLSCFSVEISIPVVYEKPDEDAEKGMRKRSVLMKNESLAHSSSNVCAFRHNYDCQEFDRFGGHCFKAGTEQKKWMEAKLICNGKDSNLFVPHIDRDIQSALAALEASGVKNKDIWLGQGTNGTKWVNYDGSVEDYYRWRTGVNFNSAGALASTLDLAGRKYYGYESVARSDQNYNYLCHRCAFNLQYSPKKVGNVRRSSTGY